MSTAAMLIQKENIPTNKPHGKALSSGELKMMLGQCLKMASENKITTNNTWGLPLIEHLDDLIREEDPTQHTNFQRASVTLDAGVKIYSYRVDSVHTETFKMLGGLGRASGPAEEGGEGDPGNGGVEGETASPSKRRRQRGDLNPDATLEPNLESLNVKKFDLAFAVDPLFHKTSAQFDEGGAKGLLLNNLSVYRGCEIVFDSMDVPEAALDDCSRAGARPESSPCIEIDSLKPYIVALGSMSGHERITPTLDDILALLDARPATKASADAEQFVNRVFDASASSSLSAGNYVAAAASAPGSPANMAVDAVGNDGGSGAQDGDAMPAAAYDDALNVDAEHQYAIDDDDFGDYGGGIYDDDDDDADGNGHAFRATDRGNHPASQDHTALSSHEHDAHGDGSLQEDAIHWLIAAGTSSTTATTSYVTASKGWAGASHWRYRAVPQNIGSDAAGNDSDNEDGEVEQGGARRNKRGGSARQRRNAPLDFVALMADGAPRPEFDMMPRGGKKTKRRARAAAKTLLPEDHHYAVESLARYALRPRSMVALATSASGSRLYGDSARDGFMDRTGSGDVGIDAAMDVFGGFAGDGDDDDDYDGDAGCMDAYGSMPEEWGVDAAGGGGGGERNDEHGDGFEVVDAAHRVDKVDVNYARAAKQVDVRSLKELMWEGIKVVLSRPDRSVHEPVELSEVLATVPVENRAGRLEDLSVHLCFICILHLANEHGLKINGVGELNKMLISGAPGV